MPQFFVENNQSNSQDSSWRMLQKIVSLLQGGGGGGGLGTLTGVGSPNGSVSGTIGQLYVNQTDGSIWISGGGTTWTIYTGPGGQGTLTGHGNPNGVVTGTAGQLYSDLDAPGTIWQNLDSAQAWGP